MSRSVVALLLLSASVAQAAPHAVKLTEGKEVPPPDPKAKHQPPMRTTLLVDEELAGGKRASMALLYVSPKQRVAMHRHPGSAELLYVVEGRGRILSPGMEPGELEPGAAVFVKAGAAHAFDVQSPQKPLKLIQVFAPLGPERVFRDRSKSAGFEVIKGKAAPDKEAFVLILPDKPMPLPLPSGKGKVKMLLDPGKLGEQQAYLGVLELEPGAEVPLHKHDRSAELLFVLDGQTEITMGGEAIKADKDTAIHVPENTQHSGRAPKGARILQIYAPAGPEQRFLGAKK